MIKLNRYFYKDISFYVSLILFLLVLNALFRHNLISTILLVIVAAMQLVYASVQIKRPNDHQS
ncbi:hypothetical protein FHQ08_03330 [Lactobacillus sp. CC-MHH1034]|uniref:hypothetical protein n=1 Tax=Agrilactobacillus fermenti TaxID=2586909 RepID=UPI001E4D3829|nr:hypothetical protein [Agrilactobacillus fermenti]MCD2255747.1 hypothetical protein [Agrilactobacillus fermenti]